jgi:hypothetical protein
MLFIECKARFTEGEIAGVMEALKEWQVAGITTVFGVAHSVAMLFEEKALTKPSYWCRRRLNQFMLVKLSDKISRC